METATIKGGTPQSLGNQPPYVNSSEHSSEQHLTNSATVVRGHAVRA